MKPWNIQRKNMGTTKFREPGKAIRKKRKESRTVSILMATKKKITGDNIKEKFSLMTGETDLQ